MAKYDSIDEDVFSIPVILKSLYDDAILCDAFDKFERSCANRMLGKCITPFLRCLGGDHHSGATGQICDKRRIWRRKTDLYTIVTEGIDARDRTVIALGNRAGQI